MSSTLGILDVTIPAFAEPEIRYMLKVYLSSFLGLKYTVKVDQEIKHTILRLNDVQLIIKNTFWRKAKNPYLLENIPATVEKQNIAVGNTSYPTVAIYGQARLTQEGKIWTLSLDIIASGFFMLSRWEEHINKKRDSHKRFPAIASLAVKQKFLNRPVVNEYTELLWALLQEMGLQQKRKTRTFQIVPTHDVDLPYYFRSTVHYFKKTAWQLSKIKFKAASRDTAIFLKGDGPYDYHHKQMDDAEKIGTRGHFFFMTGGTSKYDPGYKIENKKISKLISEIQDRGHHIGLHPSYNAYNDPQLFSEEKQKLEEAIGTTVTTGRQHYLRFSIPETWRIWEANNMEWDSTLGYAGQAGFRCGACYEFPVFDFIERNELKLKEKPLIMMEVSLKQYENLAANQAIKRIEILRSTIERYNGSFVYLWHNSSYEKDGWEKYNQVYESLVNKPYS